MQTSEQRWDQLLRIDTAGRDDSRADEYRYPYEPTPYCVLERLAASGHLRADHVLVDYGCGKGRVGFFLHHAVGCRVIGVEYDPVICRLAEENRARFRKPDGIRFVCCRAEVFDLAEADCFYFFNPFSPEILQAVLGQILSSWYEQTRPMKLLFYYPSDACRTILMTAPDLTFADELDCRDLFATRDPRETLLIFTLGEMLGTL